MCTTDVVVDSKFPESRMKTDCCLLARNKLLGASNSAYLLEEVAGSCLLEYGPSILTRRLVHACFQVCLEPNISEISHLSYSDISPLLKSDLAVLDGGEIPLRFLRSRTFFGRIIVWNGSLFAVNRTEKITPLCCSRGGLFYQEQ